MRPARADEPQIDPRRFLAEMGEEAFSSFLAERGRYRLQQTTERALVEALASGMPILVEGRRGCGKSTLGESMSLAFNLPHYHLQCMPGLGRDDILFTWDRIAQRAAAPEARWTREMLECGEVLAAFDYVARTGRPAVVLVDEIDKLEPKNQYMLLQLLESGFVDVPRLVPTSAVGVTAEGAPWPVVVLTSNDREHAVIEPLRSRCVYAWVLDPTPREEAAILRVRCPEAPFSLVREAVRLLAHIRRMPTISEKPGLREAVRFVAALVRKGAREISPETIDRHVCYLAKRERDQMNLVAARFAVAAAARTPAPAFDAEIGPGPVSHDEEAA